MGRVVRFFWGEVSGERFLGELSVFVAIVGWLTLRGAGGVWGRA